MMQEIEGVPVRRTDADVPPDSMSYKAFADVDQWCKRQEWRHYTDFWTTMRSGGGRITMFYRFKDANKEMMFKLAWFNQ